MKKIILLIIIALAVTIYNNNQDYVEVPSTSIRMRVIAKSNNKEDQNNKMIIKNAVEKKLYKIIDKASSYDEVNELIEDSKDELDYFVQEIIDKNNIDTTFTSNYGYNYFPSKEFKGFNYKAGNYKSYVVTLGEGEGENWWCVLYPPLCLVDENVEDYEYHSIIKDILLKYN